MLKHAALNQREIGPAQPGLVDLGPPFAGHAPDNGIIRGAVKGLGGADGVEVSQHMRSFRLQIEGPGMALAPFRLLLR
ncbi:MAG: hypothetical protein Kow00124_18920 [Anaerolineae bacterium]